MGKKFLATVAVLLFLVSSLVILIPTSSAEGDGELPASFDQRDLGIVTPPKRQNPWGTCWAFGGTGAAETAILTAMGKTYEETGLDLSERHTAYFAETPVYEPITDSQQGEGIHSVSDDPNAPFDNGGQAYYFAQLFSTGAGPIYEEDYPYHGDNSISCSQFYTEYRDRAVIEITKENSKLKKELPYYDEDEREELFNEWISQGLVFPEGVDASNFTFDDFVNATIDYYAKKYQVKDDYCEYDYWALDINERNYTTGYTLMNGYRIDTTRLLNNEGQWIGVDWNRTADVKNELLLGHGLVLSYHYDKNGYNEELGTQFGTWSNSNHCVQIVGWNDNISKDDFACHISEYTFQPEGDGAWLCKNSWGSETYGYEVNGETYYTDWGIKDEQGKHTGYFWLSYYDRSIRRIESISFSDSLLNNEEFGYYVYDYLPDSVNGRLTTKKPSAMANVFTSEGHVDIQAISICTREFDSTATVMVYLNPTYGFPASGKLVFETEVSFHLPGIHTLYLAESLQLLPGQRFSVVMDERNSEGEYVIGANMALDEEHSVRAKLYGVAVVNKNESYLYWDGKWSDLTDSMGIITEQFTDYAVDNFSIKVFTTDRVDEEPPASYTAAVIAIMIVPAVAILFLRRH